MCCPTSADPRAASAARPTLHGGGGEWKVARQRLRWDILEAFRDAAEEIGIPRRDDFNDGDNEGSGYFEVNQVNGIRWTAAKAFLRPAQRRPNLRVLTGALVTGVAFDGKRAMAGVVTLTAAHAKRGWIGLYAAAISRHPANA